MMTGSIRSRALAAWVLAPSLLAASSAGAVSLAIVDTPQETSGPFRHNVFHTASSNNGESGTIKGWFTLGAGGGSWDDTTGAFSINVDIFSDSALTTAIGTAVGTGTLDPSAFNGHDGGLIGTIYWDFDATAEGKGFTDLQQSFVDINYVTSSAGYTANSRQGNAITLWGADTAALTNVNTGTFDTGATTLGTDLVVSFVPVPAAVWLFGSGLLGLVGVARRRGA